jgi:hypothetical protein
MEFVKPLLGTWNIENGGSVLKAERIENITILTMGPREWRNRLNPHHFPHILKTSFGRSKVMI